MQRGSLMLSPRRRGPHVWEYRWREYGPNGTCIHKRIVIGNIAQFPDKVSAAQAVAGLQRQSTRTETDTKVGLTLAELVQHFIQRELGPDAFLSRSFSTRLGYQQYLKTWVLPHWGKYDLNEIEPICVEAWMVEQKVQLATRAKIRSLMHVLFNHACRYGFCDHNPIRWVRVRKKRKQAPDILTFDEASRLLSALKFRERLLVLLDLVTALRRSELFALKWSDIDFENGQIEVRRNIAYQVVGRCKTESSRKPVPLHPSLAEALLEWRAQSKYSQPDDWVFASPASRGLKPYWSAPIMRYYIQPAARRIGITKSVAWHTFRRTFASWQKLLGTDVKVIQELMRHSSILTTLDTYIQGMTVAKQAAQNGLIARLFGTADDSQRGLASQVSSSVKGIEQVLHQTMTALNLLVQSLAPIVSRSGALPPARGSP